MLSEEDKIEVFRKCLNIRNGSYGDYMKEELIFYFFEAGNNIDFLERLNSEDEIR